MALETSRGKINASGNSLVLNLPVEPAFVEADLTRIAQIFLNLLNNAAKFSSPGGMIEVSAETEENEVAVSVRDTGRGIEPEALSHIFEMFGQVETAEKQDLGGLGIGLSVSRQLAEMHGGSIEAISGGLGQGAEFVVRLPLSTGQGDVKEVVKEDEAVATAVHRRVLVVDDNRDAAEMLEMLLTINGHTVQKAYEGETAIATAREFEPEVCLLDIGLPGMNGFELAGKLREFLPDSLLISVSGWGQPEDRQRSHEAGFDRHFVKPVEIDSLLRVITSKG
jgi:CheY-like chemotaxis protein